MLLLIYGAISLILSSMCYADPTDYILNQALMSAGTTAYIIDQDLIAPGGTVTVTDPGVKLIIQAKNQDVVLVFLDDMNIQSDPNTKATIVFDPFKNRNALGHIGRDLTFLGASGASITFEATGSGLFQWQIEKGRAITFIPHNSSSDKHEESGQVEWFKEHTPNVTDRDILITDDIDLVKTTVIKAKRKDVTVYLKKDITIAQLEKAKLVVKAYPGRTVTFHIDKKCKFTNKYTLPFFIQLSGGGFTKWRMFH